MTVDGSAGSPQADDRGISKFEIRNSNSEIASHLGIHYTTVSKVIKEMED